MRWIAWTCIALSLGCGGAPERKEASQQDAAVQLEVAPDVGERLQQYAPTELTADLSALSDEDREVLAHLVKAARYMDEIFWRQVWRGNPTLRDRLRGQEGPRAEAAKAYFQVNFGPWDRLAEMEAFVGDEPHPEGAGFYPEDLSEEEFDAWLVRHPEQADSFRSLTTVIHRQDEGLVTSPYSREYEEWLTAAARELRSAAERTPNPSLERFLTLRAEAFLNDDYYASDLAWMDLDAPIEVTIGPYEVYEDRLFGFKSAFTAFITVALPEESARLEGYKAQLPWLERNLPIPDRHKNLGRGTESPIRVVDLVFSAGDAKAGVQTIAFNLPNDERVREAKGSKNVLLRNMIRAKYERILVPIAQRVLVPDQAASLSFGAFLEEVLHHELAHGLGPGMIVVGGRQTEVRLELRDLYPTVEEAKADVTGVYDILALIDRGVIPAELRAHLEPTYLAGLFRAARFGIGEAHGRGVVAQFNYLQERGALEVDEEGRYRAISDAFPGAIRDLVRELLLLQARGDYEATAEFLERYGTASASLVAAVGALDDLPVDVRPIFPQAGVDTEI